MAVKRQWQRPLDLSRPTWDMIRFNNIYTDSRKDFRRRFCPVPEEEKILTSVYTTMSFEYADDVESVEFSFSEEGFEEAKVWVESKFREFVEVNFDRY